MPNKKAKPAVSEKQCRLFGAVASGEAKVKGFSRADAMRKLRAGKGKKLPK